MSDRERLHQMVDLLADSDLPLALRVVEYLRGQAGDAVRRVLMRAPEDDEPLSPEDERALDRAIEEIGRGETKPWPEVRQRLG
jgi:hypothetical protein